MVDETISKAIENEKRSGDATYDQSTLRHRSVVDHRDQVVYSPVRGTIEVSPVRNTGHVHVESRESGGESLKKSKYEGERRIFSQAQACFERADTNRTTSSPITHKSSTESELSFQETYEEKERAKWFSTFSTTRFDEAVLRLSISLPLILSSMLTVEELGVLCVPRAIDQV